MAIMNLDQWVPATLSRESYRIGPGDILGIYVKGKALLNYKVRPDAGPDQNPNEVIVSPNGDIHIPLAGKIPCAGMTVPELEDAVKTALSKYIREFDVSISVNRVRTVNVWMSGETENPGPHILPAVATVSLAVMQSGVKHTGSTRRIGLTRGGEKLSIDLYRMSVTGVIDGDVSLEPGDVIHVPVVTDYVEVRGEVVRPGRYEMVDFDGDSRDFNVSDVVKLAHGTTPAAALDRVFIERIDGDGGKSRINVDLKGGGGSTIMKVGDVLLVPSIEAFQPMIRLIGEFRGEGVYKRSPGGSETDLENRTGIYFLKRGQTILDVILATGGVTPQADLKRARIERRDGEKVRVIPVDLDRLLVQKDKSVDVALENGDSIVLPSVADKIHVFGEVRSPGSFVYSPSRRLVDYLGDAGGPTDLARLTEVSVVRGPAESPTVVRIDARRAIRGTSLEGNPELEPGDIVFVPQMFVSGWRDGLQLLFSSLSLASLLSR